MQYIYVRAPGPGAVIRLLERFSGAEPWEISVTPADVHSGYRCLSVSLSEPAAFANYLAMCLRDTVFVVETSNWRLRVMQHDHDKSDVAYEGTLVVDVRVSSLPIIGYHQVSRAMKSASLPSWVTKLKHLKAVPYETVAVLDQRDLLVEAGDVRYTAQGNMPD
jgi:hypothetical protein